MEGYIIDMDTDINILYKMLSWNSTKKIQNKGIEKAARINDLSIFMQPGGDKSIWENCAKVIANKENEELKEYLKDLFDWIADLNWPGALTILKKLKSMPANFIYSEYENAIRRAITEKNENYLYFLSELLENKELKNKVDKKLIEKIEENRKNIMNNE